MNKYTVACIVALALMGGGCASSPTAMVIVSPDYSAGLIKRVALVDFQDFPSMAGSGDLVAGIFDKYLLLGSYNAVDRSQVQAVMQSQNLQVSDNADPQTLGLLGKALGVDALVFGQVDDFTDSQAQTVTEDVPLEESDPVYGTQVTVQRAGGTELKTIQSVVTGYNTTEGEQSVQETVTKPARVAISVRLVDVKSGDVLWSGSCTGHGPHLNDAAEDAANQLMKSVAEKLKEEAKS